MHKIGKMLSVFSLLLVLTAVTKIAVADTANPLTYEDDDIYLRLVIRSKEQLTAFYTGREFPKPAIAEIVKTCFITPIIRNRSSQALWIEPDSWSFLIDGIPVERLKRDYWKRIWDKTGLSLAHQSTFGWTLLPETRDLQHDESAGGNIVIPMQNRPFTLKARFNTGANKQGTPKTITFQNVSCAN